MQQRIDSSLTNIKGLEIRNVSSSASDSSQLTWSAWSSWRALYNGQIQSYELHLGEFHRCSLSSVTPLTSDAVQDPHRWTRRKDGIYSASISGKLTSLLSPKVKWNEPLYQSGHVILILEPKWGHGQKLVGPYPSTSVELVNPEPINNWHCWIMWVQEFGR